MAAKAVLLDANDNVATCTSDVAKGVAVECVGDVRVTVVSIQDIPMWHKIALSPIGKGEKVFKYGEIIGEASVDIPEGGWVSHENIFSVPRDYVNEYSAKG